MSVGSSIQNGFFQDRSGNAKLNDGVAIVKINDGIVDKKSFSKRKSLSSLSRLQATDFFSS